MPHLTELNSSILVDSFSPQNAMSLSPLSPFLDIQFDHFHKIMWCKNEGYYRVAVQYGEQTLKTYNITSMPTGSLTLSIEHQTAN